ncbi:MAG: hypothetical protein ACE5D8_05865 [Fidelibacterota bacterium]
MNTGRSFTIRWVLLLIGILEVGLQGQTESPLFHNPPDWVTPGVDQVITVSTFTAENARSATLFYRTRGNHSYQEIPMRSTGLSWEGTIPGHKISSDGIEYAIVILTHDSGTIGYPADSPLENPQFVPAKQIPEQGRRFPGSDQYAATQAMEAELLILAPEPGSAIPPEDIVVAASFFHAPFVDSSTIEVTIDGISYTDRTLVAGGIINTLPDYLEPGPHTVTITMSSVYGVPIEPVAWSFTTVKSGFNLEEQLLYSGEISSRSSLEYNSGTTLNYSELSGKVEVGVTWIGADAQVRLSTRESPYEQPYNRLSLSLGFGDYLSINMGDYFPSFNAFTVDGKRIRGLGVNIRLPWIKFYSVSGIINQSVQWGGKKDEGYVFYPSDIRTDTLGNYIFPLDRTGYTFERSIKAYQLKIQPIKRFSLGLHAIKAMDDRASIDRILPASATFTADTLVTPGTYTYTSFRDAVSAMGGSVDLPDSKWSGGDPEDNFVVGFEMAGIFDQNKLRIELDWNMSLYNRNIWDGALTLTELDTALDDSLDGLIGVEYDENGLVIAGGLMVDTAALINPTKYEEFFTVNQYMTPLVPLDIASFQKSPVATIVNMPSSAYALRLIGNYYFNSFSIEYYQVGPEFVSLGNPYLSSNVREFTMKNRIKLLDNKILIAVSYQHRDNKILRTQTDPLNTNTFSASMSIMPGMDAPSLMFNFQSINKDNEKTEIEKVAGTPIDLRENSTSLQTTMSLNYPITLPTSSHNIVINFNTIRSVDNFANDRRRNYLFPKTDTRAYGINMSSRFASELRTVISTSLTELELPTFNTKGEIVKKPYLWMMVALNGTYPIWGNKLRLIGGLDWMASQGDINSSLYGFKIGGDYEIIEHLVANLSANFRWLHTPVFNRDKIDNDQNGKTDEFLESWELNSSGILLSLGYRF